MNNKKIDNLNNTFGEKLKKLRKSKGFTQQSLAEKADIDEKHLCRIERGKYFPTYTTLNKLLKALNLKIEDLGLNLEQLELDTNPLISKALAILNSAKNDDELFCYIEALKTTQKAFSIYSKHP